VLLDTKDMDPVDILIRTGGDRRVSNYLLWQIAYSELFFTDTLWPDFTPKEFDKAIEWYRKQKRNKWLINRFIRESDILMGR